MKNSNGIISKISALISSSGNEELKGVELFILRTMHHAVEAALLEMGFKSVVSFDNYYEMGSIRIQLKRIDKYI